MFEQSKFGPLNPARPMPSPGAAIQSLPASVDGSVADRIEPMRGELRANAKNYRHKAIEAAKQREKLKQEKHWFCMRRRSPAVKESISRKYEALRADMAKIGHGDPKMSLRLVTAPKKPIDSLVCSIRTRSRLLATYAPMQRDWLSGVHEQLPKDGELLTSDNVLRGLKAVDKTQSVYQAKKRHLEELLGPTMGRLLDELARLDGLRAWPGKSSITIAKKEQENFILGRPYLVSQKESFDRLAVEWDKLRRELTCTPVGTPWVLSKLEASSPTAGYDQNLASSGQGGPTKQASATRKKVRFR